MLHRVMIIVVFCCLLLSTASRSNATVLVRFEPTVINVQPGESFTIDLRADLDSHQVIGWGLDLPYDAALLTPGGTPIVGPLWWPSFAPDGDGLTGFAPAAAVTGQGVLLARLTYRALQPGQTQLLAGYTPADLNEGFALDPFGYADVSFQAATVNVAPEPAAWLVVSLCALLVRRRWPTA